MTKREFLEMVIAQVEIEEMVEYAKSEIEKMDARNAKRAGEKSKKAKENEPIKAQIAEVIGEEPKLAKEVAELVGISTQKASALCRQMVGDGVLKVEDVKVKGKGTQKAYSVA